MLSTDEICRNCVLPKRAFSDGEELLTEGSTTGRLFVLETGRVRISRNDVELTMVSKPGAVFGEISLLLDRPHTATVRSIGDTVCFLIEDGPAFLQERPEFHLHVSRLLAHRLAALTNYLTDLKKQFASSNDHLGMVDEVLDGIAHDHPRKL